MNLICCKHHHGYVISNINEDARNCDSYECKVKETIVRFQAIPYTSTCIFFLQTSYQLV